MPYRNEVALSNILNRFPFPFSLFLFSFSYFPVFYFFFFSFFLFPFLFIYFQFMYYYILSLFFLFFLFLLSRENNCFANSTILFYFTRTHQTLCSRFRAIAIILQERFSIRSAFGRLCFCLLYSLHICVARGSFFCNVSGSSSWIKAFVQVCGPRLFLRSSLRASKGITGSSRVNDLCVRAGLGDDAESVENDELND